MLNTQMIPFCESVKITIHFIYPYPRLFQLSSMVISLCYDAIIIIPTVMNPSNNLNYKEEFYSLIKILDTTIENLGHLSIRVSSDETVSQDDV